MSSPSPSPSPSPPPIVGTTNAVLADAVVAFLAAKLPSSISIARRRIVYTSLEAMAGLKVSVIPFGVNRSQEAEGVHEIRPDIRIVVQRKLSGTSEDSDQTEADETAAIAEQITALLVGTTLLDRECQSANMANSYDPRQLATLGVFDAAIHTLWYTVEDGPDD